jgi:putative ABC transport system permease protein
VSPAVRLGLRLAVGTPGQRARSTLVVFATVIGAWLLLSTLAVGRAIALTPSGDSASDRARLALSVVTAVAVPILVLAASVGRLSASVRERRLANLRLLGLSAADTRRVAASEAGAAALAGMLAGALLYVATQPLLVHLSLAGHGWEAGTLSPGPIGWPLVLVGLPALVAGSASIPVRRTAAVALARARRASIGRPSVWWAAPLAVGTVLCVVQLFVPRQEHPGNAWFGLFFAGAILSGLGVVLVAPWVVCGVADLLARHAPGPVTRVAARRLQSQPGGVVRAISALMVGLFLVSGARGVLVAFEENPRYAVADAAVHDGQRVLFGGGAKLTARAEITARSVRGVTDVINVAELIGDVDSDLGHLQVNVLVATCAQLLAMQPGLKGCVDAPMRVDHSRAWSGSVRLDGYRHRPMRMQVPEATLTSPSSDAGGAVLGLVQADFVVPPDTPGIQGLALHSRRIGVVIGTPGRDLPARLGRAGVPVESSPDFGYYDFVEGLRAILWTVASVVLGVGLLTLAIGGIDRAASRGRELVSLRVLGTSPSVLRRAQLLEAAIPTVIGSALAIASGFLAGATYLRMAELDVRVHLPWASTLGLATIAVGAALVVAALTVVATNVRLTPDLIRHE